MKMLFKRPPKQGGPRFQTGSNTAPNVIKPIATRASWRRAIADLSPRPMRLVLRQMERGSGAMQHQPILLAVAHLRQRSYATACADLPSAALHESAQHLQEQRRQA